ncbi:hypothetical protein SAMN06298216_4222 [Spirosomataceae bacterium TFI 002]|nr:hypothetical protein SAMN06298216_4222 [Spirosomataceae bacterium TFI 002]
MDAIALGQLKKNETSRLMKKSILLLSLLFFYITFAQAQTVKYLSSGADLDAEITAGAVGDTYILGPGSYAGNTIITKRVTLIGPGYFNSSGPTGEASILGTISVNTGAENSLITGLSFVNNVHLAASDIIFQRNKITSQYFYFGYNTAGQQPATNGMVVKENYIATTGGLYFYGQPTTNFLFQNNIVQGDMVLSSMNNASTGSFINNVFGAGSIASQGDGFAVPGNASGLGLEFVNNIFAKTLLTNSNNLFASANYVPNVFKYNVLLNTSASFAGITPPTNNSFGNTLSNIFAGFPTNAAGLAFDEQYILSPSSPAKNFGRLSPYTSTDPTTDAGAFGNSSPYLNSGTPIGPSIYQLTIPNVAATNSVVPVTIKAKSNN